MHVLPLPPDDLPHCEREVRMSAVKHLRLVDACRVVCGPCGLRFDSEEARAAHMIGEACMPESSLWSRGWRSVKDKWELPPQPKRARSSPRINEDEVWRCVLCKKAFGCLVAFKAHHVFTFTSAERCLDHHERVALDFHQSAMGVWSIEKGTQYRPHQVIKLPTIRPIAEMLGEGPGFSVSEFIDRPARAPDRSEDNCPTLRQAA